MQHTLQHTLQHALQQILQRRRWGSGKRSDMDFDTQIKAFCLGTGGGKGSIFGYACDVSHLYV